MAVPKIELLAVAAPAVVCGGLLLVAWRPWRRDAPIAGGAWGGVIGLGAAYCLGHAVLEGRPAFPPKEAWHWLAYLVVAAMVIGLLDAMNRWGARARLGAWVVLAGLTGWLVVLPAAGHAWLWRAGLAVAVFGWLSIINAYANRVEGASLPLSLCFAASGASVLLLLSGNAKLALLAGGVAASLGTTTVVTWWRPSASLARGSATVLAVIIPGLLYSGYSLSFSEIPIWAYALAAAAPMAAWARQVRPISRLAGWQATIVAVIASLAATLIAIAGAVAATASTNDFPV